MDSMYELDEIFDIYGIDYGTTTTYSSGADEMVISILMSYLGGLVIALIALWVFNVIIRWKVFEKAGVAGWKSIIPFYGDYVEYSIVWEGKWYLFTLAASVVMSAVWFIPVLGPIAAVAAVVFLEIISVVFAMQEAKAFGQDTGFALGLLFIPFVFKFFLAFDQDVLYKGPQASPKFFGTIKQQLPSAQPAAYQPPTGYQQPYVPQGYQQPTGYQPPVTQPTGYQPPTQPTYVPPQAPEATPAPETAPVVETAPIPEAVAAPEPPVATEAPTSGVPVPRFDPETGLPLQ